MKQICRFTLLALMVILSACQNNLKEQVAQAAAHCPIDITNVGFVNNISLRGDTLVYDCVVTNTTVNLDALAAEADGVKRRMAPTILQLFDSNPAMIKSIQDNHLVLSIRYRAANRAHATPLVINYTTDELRRTTRPEQAESRHPDQVIADEIAISKVNLPVEMAPAVMMTDIYDSGTYIVYVCSVNEEQAGADAMANLRANMPEMRREMLDMFRSGLDKDVQRLVEIALSANHGIAYEYHGSATGDTLTARFTPQELRPSGKTERK